jgi:hypothetical protein
MRQLKSFNFIQTVTTMAAVYAVLGAIAGVLFSWEGSRAAVSWQRLAR